MGFVAKHDDPPLVRKEPHSIAHFWSWCSQLGNRGEAGEGLRLVYQFLDNPVRGERSTVFDGNLESDVS